MNDELEIYKQQLVGKSSIDIVTDFSNSIRNREKCRYLLEMFPRQIADVLNADRNGSPLRLVVLGATIVKNSDVFKFIIDLINLELLDDYLIVDLCQAVIIDKKTPQCYIDKLFGDQFVARKKLQMYVNSCESRLMHAVEIMSTRSQRCMIDLLFNCSTSQCMLDCVAEIILSATQSSTHMMLFLERLSQYVRFIPVSATSYRAVMHISNEFPQQAYRCMIEILHRSIPTRRTFTTLEYVLANHCGERVSSSMFTLKIFNSHYYNILINACVDPHYITQIICDALMDINFDYEPPDEMILIVRRHFAHGYSIFAEINVYRRAIITLALDICDIDTNAREYLSSSECYDYIIEELEYDEHDEELNKVLERFHRGVKI